MIRQVGKNGQLEVAALGTGARQARGLGEYYRAPSGTPTFSKGMGRLAGAASIPGAVHGPRVAQYAAELLARGGK